MESSASETQSRSRVLSSILDASKKGVLKGIIGRLGDLGAIDEKYDVAVTTAISKLNVIVCETYEDG